MSATPDASRSFRWTWFRHIVQVAAIALFAAPVLIAGWSLFGASVGGDDPLSTPADLPFFGSLSSSSVGGLALLDPFGVLQVIVASKTAPVEWLLAALPHISISS